jgi:ribosomal-protein-alanine N-acetyltransferase
MTPALRRYGPGDLSELARIDAICFPRDIAFSRAELRFYAGHPAAVSRVAEVDGQIVGFIVARIERRAAHVITLDVVPGMRRRGIGRALLDELHAVLERGSTGAVLLEVDTANHAAVAFYESLGYRRLELLEGYYNGRSDAFRMVRRVTREAIGNEENRS